MERLKNIPSLDRENCYCGGYQLTGLASVYTNVALANPVGSGATIILREFHVDLSENASTCNVECGICYAPPVMSDTPRTCLLNSNQAAPEGIIRQLRHTSVVIPDERMYHCLLNSTSGDAKRDIKFNEPAILHAGETFVIAATTADRNLSVMFQWEEVSI